MAAIVSVLNILLMGLVIITLLIGWFVPITITRPPDFFVNKDVLKDNNTIYMSVSFDCSIFRHWSGKTEQKCAHASNMSEWRTACFALMVILTGIVLIVIFLNLLALCFDAYKRFELFIIGYAVSGVLGTTALILYATKVSPPSEFTEIISGFYILLISFLAMFALSGLSFIIDPYNYPGF